MKWLRRLSVAKKLSIIISLIFLILVLGLVNFWFTSRLMSAVRGYVAGEGIWSKAQKGAVTSLIKYSISFDEKDYNDYKAFLDIPLGDYQARLEMDKPEPDLELNRKWLIQGGNSPEDVDDLAFLYRRFRWVSYMRVAIEDWRKGDEEFMKLMKLGDQIHALISDKKDMEDPAVQEARLSELSTLVMKVYETDERLSELEHHFSATLGEGSRRIRDILFIVTVVLSILLGAITLSIAVYIAQLIIEVDKKKNEFVYLVSHQLKTPLTSISWYTELLLKKEADDAAKRKKYASEINTTNRRMIDLINALLNVSRIEMGTFIVNPVKGNVVTMVDEVIELFKIQLSLKKLKLTTRYEEKLPSVLVDQQVIRIAISNILSNAIKYSYDGGEVTISLYKKGNFINIQIDDEGIGIPKSQQGRLFEKFFRADNAKTMNTDGSGLGLYIVESIIRSAGGKLAYASAENEGSSFIISLPLEGMKRREGTKQLH